MSSTYSSRQPSLSELPVIQHEFAKSAPVTPGKARHHPVFRTVPDSPRHNRLLSSDDDGLDLEILTHKLQLYQLELEEAELRFKHKRTMQDKHAADVAAAARFRDGLDKLKQFNQGDGATAKRTTRSRSTSLQKSESANRRSSPVVSALTKPARMRRPQPLLLADTDVEPQEVQSAALPTRTFRGSGIPAADVKKHWRRTTISAGRHSKIVLLSSSGKPEYCDFDVPPVPQLSASTSTATSPPSMSPMTPMITGPTEDQIRRELETFALEEGPNIQLSRRSSVVSRRRMPAAFVPDPEDRLPGKRLPPMPPPPPEIPSAFVDTLDHADPHNPYAPALTRKKSFFSRFEKKVDVDSVLDLYMTDEQLDEVRAEKKAATKSRRQTFFKKWQPAETLSHNKSGRPG